MIAGHAALAVFIALAPPGDRLTPDSMMVELRKGGYTIIWRHAATDYTMRDVPGAAATKMSCDSESAWPSNRARAIATARRFSSIGFV